MRGPTVLKDAHDDLVIAAALVCWWTDVRFPRKKQSYGVAVTDDRK